MKTIVLACLMVLSLSRAAAAVPVTWTFSGVADSGQWNGTSLAGLAYQIRLFKDVDPADFGLGDWSLVSGEIDVDTLGTHVSSFCTTSLPASCSPTPFQFIETFSVGTTADALHFRGPGGTADSQVRVPFGTLGANPDLLTAFGPVQTLGNGQTHINASDGVPNNLVTPSFALFDTDGPASPIVVAVAFGTPSAVPEGGSSLLFVMVAGLAFAAAHHRWVLSV